MPAAESNPFETAARKPRRFDLVGRRFGRLLVLAFSHKASEGAVVWACRCDCGKDIAVRAASLLRRAPLGTRSCGCYAIDQVRKANTRHGHWTSPTHSTWRQMLSRAHTGSATCAADYFGRGIRVCERWLKFENFLADMGERPSGLTLDRINNNGNYEPGNCRWATVLEQQRNRRSNKLVTAFGRTQPMSVWAGEIGISGTALSNRLRRYPIEVALTKKKRGIA